MRTEFSGITASVLDKPNEQIGGQVARQRCLKFDLSTVDASPTKEYPAE
jgi:hypothetical protein